MPNCSFLYPIISVIMNEVFLKEENFPIILSYFRLGKALSAMYSGTMIWYRSLWLIAAGYLTELFWQICCSFQIIVLINSFYIFIHMIPSLPHFLGVLLKGISCILILSFFLFSLGRRDWRYWILDNCKWWTVECCIQ